MKSLLNSSAFYFLAPIYAGLFLVLIFFNIPKDFLPSLLALGTAVTVIFLLSRAIHPFDLGLEVVFKRLTAKPDHKKTILLLIFAIIASGPIDIYVNGFKLLNPMTYAEFNGAGRYVRHISSLCWILVPASFLFFRGFLPKFFLNAYAIIFPILIVDRNRLFMAFFALLICLVFFGRKKEQSEIVPRQVSQLKIILLICAMLAIFAIVGYFRSGNSFIVDTSGEVLIPGSFPLRGIFSDLPGLLQQIVLYVAAPAFNFATILFYDFRNEEFLLSQLSPFGREAFEAYPYAPVMVERFNVGTEFYPWLLYGGISLVVATLVVMILTFIISVILLRSYPNIFTLLIFLRISYIVLFMGFAPQFFILLNAMFIILMLALWLASSTATFLFSKDRVSYES